MHRSRNHPVRNGLAALLAASAAAVIPASARAAPPATPLPPPTNTAPPQIQQPPGAKRQNEVATPMVGEYLLGNKGTWNGASYYKVQWEDCDSVAAVPPAPPTMNCTAAAGTPSTNTTYKVAAGDVGHMLVFLVTAFSSPGSSTPVSSAPSGAVAFGAPLNRLAPMISGVTQDGQTLSVTSGTWERAEPTRRRRSPTSGSGVTARASTAARRSPTRRAPSTRTPSRTATSVTSWWRTSPPPVRGRAAPPPTRRTRT